MASLQMDELVNLSLLLMAQRIYKVNQNRLIFIIDQHRIIAKRSKQDLWT